VIIDAQVHAYEANSPSRPWVSDEETRSLPEATGEQTVATMDASGVDGAVLVSTWVKYHDDTSYAEEVFARYPERFRLVAPIDPAAAGLEARVERWTSVPGAVGFRILFMPRAEYGPDHPGVATTFRGASAAGMPVNVFSWGNLEAVDVLARTYPDAQLVIDHCGMHQPLGRRKLEHPFADIDQVVALARFSNVAIKLTGVCSVSHQPFPYEDVWGAVGQLIDAFGVERSMWGTDWTRAVVALTYDEATRAFRDHMPFSDGDRAAIMGANAARIYGWDRAGAGAGTGSAAQ
jgi:L-fuconolactonase